MCMQIHFNFNADVFSSGELLQAQAKEALLWLPQEVIQKEILQTKEKEVLQTKEEELLSSPLIAENVFLRHFKAEDCCI